MLHRPTAPSARLSFATLAASLVIALAPATASAATVKVRMGLNDFTPATRTISRGDTVKWVNPTPDNGGFLDHNVQATKPRWYFYSTKQDEGDIPPGETFQRTLRSAGRFSYTCSIHSGMDGVIVVPISVTTLSGPFRFRVTMASASSSGPWKHWVEVKKPGSTSWTRIALTSDPSVVFTPTNHGAHAFRSRVTNTTTGADSGWSPTVWRSY